MKRQETTIEELKAKYAHLSEAEFHRKPDVIRWYDQNHKPISREEIMRRVRGSNIQDKAA